MGRAPCCDKANVKRGPWSPEEDAKLKDFIHKNGTGGNWIALPQKAGLKRCGKSCRLRWLNYLRPNIKHGEFSDDEDRIICSLYANIGSRWAIIAGQLQGRTDNDIKNYWNTKLKKKLMSMIPLDQRKIIPSFSSSSSSSNSLQYQRPSSSTTLRSQIYTDNFNYMGSSSITLPSTKSLLGLDQSLFSVDGWRIPSGLHQNFNAFTSSSNNNNNNNMLMFGGGGNEQTCTSSSDGKEIKQENISMNFHQGFISFPSTTSDKTRTTTTTNQGFISSGTGNSCYDDTPQESEKLMMLLEDYGDINHDQISITTSSWADQNQNQDVFVGNTNNNTSNMSSCSHDDQLLQYDLEQVKQLMISTSGLCNSAGLIFNDENKTHEMKPTMYYY